MVPLSPINARQQAWIRALDHARLVATDAPIYLPTKDAYSVYSAHSDNDYVVSAVEDHGMLTYECECRAAENNRVCWHAALVAAEPREIQRRQRHRAASVPAPFTMRPAVLVASVAPSLADLYL